MKLNLFTPLEWKKYASDAHLLAFNEIRDSDSFAYDFILASFTNDGEMTGYIAVQEFDKKSAVLQDGCTFPNLRNTTHPARSYKLALKYLKEKYDILSCTILNSNVAMLKMAMSEGFRIIGVDYDQLRNTIVLRLIMKVEMQNLIEKVS